MSMKVNGSYQDYKKDYLEDLQGKRSRMEEIGREKSEEKNNGGFLEAADAYISSEEAQNKPSGLYRLGKNENGTPKVLFDDPKKTGKKGKKEKPVKETANREEDCTVNTDKVDREIKKLKEKKKQLEWEVRAAGDDVEKKRELEQELARVENELSQKDNDTYRRQNAQKIDM